MRIFVSLIALFIWTSAVADVVIFKNGDRLTGKVLHKLGPELAFETTHAGTVKIQWSEISTLSTDSPVAVMLEDSKKISNETLAPAAEGGTELADSSRHVPLDDIAYLNPNPEQSGIGVTYKGRATLAASDTRGNTTGRRLYGDAQLTARARDYRYNVGGKVNQQRDFGVRTASNWTTDGNYDWFLEGDKQFRYVRGSLEHDRYKDIDLRSTTGAGYGVQLLENDRSNVSIRGGLDYVIIDHYTAGNESYPALGWGVKASHRLQKYNLELFHEQDGFQQIAEGSNMILRTRTGLRAPIAAGINASIQLNLDWEKDPAPGRKSTDSALLVGLGYDW
jgi:putative salt-induced outer membrane protein YdiY